MDKLYLSENHEVVVKPRENELNSLENQMIAMGKALMRAKKTMTIEERKLLVMALTKIKWNKEGNPLEVELAKTEIEDILGWNVAAADRSTRIRRLAAKLAIHSFVQMDSADRTEYDDGFLVPRYRSTRGTLHIYFAEQFMPLLQNLTKDKDFVTIWSNDVYGFESVYAYLLFEDLRLHCDTRKVNWRTYSTRELKELFGIPENGKGSYMRPKEKGGFDRSNFEKKVLDVAIEEINQGHMVHLLPFSGMEATPEKPHKLYEKVKKNGYVVGYMFKYNVFTQTEPRKEDVVEAQLELEWKGQMVFSDIDMTLTEE